LLTNKWSVLDSKKHIMESSLSVILNCNNSSEATAVSSDKLIN